MNALAVALGGALGALARYGVNIGSARLLGLNFPYGTLTVNIIGCFAMGLLTASFAMKEPLDPSFKLFLTTGILGGFTTFSAFSFETVMLYERKPILAVIYIASSVIFSVLGCLLGMRMMRGIAL